MNKRSKLRAGLVGLLLAGGALAGSADSASAASYGVPSAHCMSQVDYNARTQRSSMQRQVAFTPNVAPYWYFNGGYHSETVFYSAELMRHTGSRWVSYYNTVIYGWDNFNSSSIGDDSRSVWHSGSYAWRVTYIYQPIGSTTWKPLGANWSNSCYMN